MMRVVIVFPTVLMTPMSRRAARTVAVRLRMTFVVVIRTVRVLGRGLLSLVMMMGRIHFRESFQICEVFVFMATSA